MDEHMQQIGSFRHGHVTATAWKETEYGDDGRSHSGWVTLLNGRRESFGAHVNQVPELVAALEQAVRCVTEKVPGAAVKFDPAALFGPGGNP
jgi:hypothetical protein